MRLLFCVILLAGCATPMFGQAAAGNITGTVVDTSGAAVAKAKGDLQSVATGVVTSTTTDAAGAERLPQLLVVGYNLSVSASGLTTRSLKDRVIDFHKTPTA